MHLHSFHLKNYRRLKDVHIELASDISIFVGANNSGKTSAAQAIQMFVGAWKDKFSVYDFSSYCWKLFDEIGDSTKEISKLPSISIDLWFKVQASDLHRVIDLLPSINWSGNLVGVRIEFAAKNHEQLLENFQEAKSQAAERLAKLGDKAGDYIPWPKTLSAYLHKELRAEFELRYFVLDYRQFDSEFQQVDGYIPISLTKEDGGAAVIRKLLRVDCLNAQRHLTDPNADKGTKSGRSEDLSKLLSQFYQRNLNQREDDHSALKALFDSEQGLNAHLSEVFKPILKKLENIAYPGLNTPRIEIISALNPASVMNQDARVHYLLGDGEATVTLPDSYNGLGYKNLIYMVVEILDLHEKWKAEEEQRAPLHLIFIEEPEAHLHAQLQQVFIRNILGLMNIDDEIDGAYISQTVVTTHSPHILYERGFTPIRYFRRGNSHEGQSCAVLNLSRFYEQTDLKDRDFLQRYLKLTHCDLFFADAAILVEGNVERLLLPAMIEKEAKGLRSACLSILEVGGAFGHRFRKLIEYLGVTVLIITDIDSVERTPANVAETDDDDEIDDLELAAESEVGAGAEPSIPEKKPRTTYRICPADKPDAITANYTLRLWLPRLKTIADLKAASTEAKVQMPTDLTPAKIRVAYQTAEDVTFNKCTARICGRTLEEAFGLANAGWCQASEHSHLKLKLKTEPSTLEELALGLHKRVVGKNFDKTRFALGLLTEKKSDWTVPAYIIEGLQWLNGELALEVEEEVIPMEGASIEATPGVAE